MEQNHFSFQLDVFVLEQEKLAMSVFDPNLHLVQNMMKHRNFRHLKGKKKPGDKKLCPGGLRTPSSYRPNSYHKKTWRHFPQNQLNHSLKV